MLCCGALLATLVGTQAVAHGGVGQAPDCTRPYSDASPWNTPIAAGAAYESDSQARVNAIGGNLSSDPSQYTYPVYYATSSTPIRPVKVSGWLSRSSANGATFGNIESPTVQVRVPAGAQPAAGSDAQVIIIDLTTGDEWGFYNFAAAADGSLTAANGYRYATQGSAAPVHPRGNGFAARGAGIPYLAGLVRPCEIERGLIEHALAFAYDAPNGTFVYPASKSDGNGTGALTLPEGARLQLDPQLSEAAIRAWGCQGACLTIARALQTYGMYVVDNSGQAKVMMEFGRTAKWNGRVTAKTAAPIPLSAFKVLEFGSGAAPPPPGGGAPPVGSVAPPAPPPGSAEQQKKKKKVKPAAKGSKRLRVAGYRVRGRQIRAGRVFQATMTLRPTKRFVQVPASLRLRCPGRIGRSVVPVAGARLTRVGPRKVTAVCRWSVPRGVRGKQLRASVRVIYRGGETRIRFVGRIRRAL